MYLTIYENIATVFTSYKKPKSTIRQHSATLQGGYGIYIVGSETKMEWPFFLTTYFEYETEC